MSQMEKGFEVNSLQKLKKKNPQNKTVSFLASSGASLVTGRVAVPGSLGTAGLLAWG